MSPPMPDKFDMMLMKTVAAAIQHMILNHILLPNHWPALEKENSTAK